MSSNSAHWWNCFWPRRREQPPSTNWQCSLEQVQRSQNTEEVPQSRAQNTDGIRYPLHQHEDPRPCKQWWNEQEVLRPRLVEETGPKRREVLGHIQRIEPQVAHNNPDTEGIRKVGTGPQTPIPATRDFDPGELPDFVRASLPDLPVQRDFAGAPLVRRLDPAGNLATMRPRSRYELKKPKVDELPTVPDVSSIVSAYMTALPPWHPLPPPSAPPSDWLNSSASDAAQEPFPIETDAEIPTQKLDPAKRKINKEATAAREFPALWQWQLMLKQKESE